MNTSDFKLDSMYTHTSGMLVAWFMFGCLERKFSSSSGT